MKEKLAEKWSEILDYIKEIFNLSGGIFNTFFKRTSLYEIKETEPGNYVATICFNDDNYHPTTVLMLTNNHSDKFDVYLTDYIIEMTGNKACTVHTEFINKSALIERNNNANNGNSASENVININPKYTFENFVVGNTNELAYSSAMAVAEDPGNIINPLFIYSGVGLGKTHLMHAIANHIAQNDKTKKILYSTTEAFTNEFITAMKEKKQAEFKEKFRSIDVLLIDDIQFLSGKDGMQEEFFHTFNTLRDNNKQIIIASDKPPKEIKNIEARLKSRFESGVIVDIQVPQYETRMAIISNKNENEHLGIPTDVLEYMANNIQSNVRELEGAMTKLLLLAKFRKSPINLELAKEACKDYINNESKKSINSSYIVGVVSEHFGITTQQMYSKDRSKNIAKPRQIAMFLIRRFTDLTYSEIGEAFGGKDHTTVMHANEKIEDDYKNNPDVKGTIDLLIKKISD